MLHADIRKALTERLRALIESQDQLVIKPRPYQSETLVCLRDWLGDVSGNRRGYISQATGLGKTWLFSAVTSYCAGLRTLIIVPTKILVEQTARFVVKFTGGLIGHLSSLERIHGTNDEIIAVRGHEHSDVVITTDESFIKRAASIAAEFGPHFIIWDECHWGYTAGAQQALAHFPEAVILGFSATPDYLGTVARSGFAPVTIDNGQVLWSDQSRLARSHFGTLINERTLRWGIENRWLAPFAWGMVECDIQLNQIPTAITAAGADYHDAALQAFMAGHWPTIVEVVRRLYADPQYTLPERQIFAVCPSIKMAMSLAQSISELGVPAACITGDTPNRERNRILSSFTAGTTKLLTSVMVLREGWDAPNAEVCLMLRPTKSRVLYLQSMGRVLRPAVNGGNKVALVVDAFFQRVKFSPLSAPVLFGTPGQTIKERDIIIRPKPLPSAPSSLEAAVKLDEEVSPYLSPDAKPRLVFVHPLEIEYWAGPDGTFEADGERWITITALTKKFAVGSDTIRCRITKNKVRTRYAMNNANRMSTFYSFVEAQKVCEDLALPQAGPRGTARIDGKLWASQNALACRFHLAPNTIESLVRYNQQVRRQNGRAQSGRVGILYCVTDARQAVQDLLVIQVHRDGTVRKGGRTWATLTAAMFHLGLSTGQFKMTKRLMKGRKIRTHPGKNRQGRRITLYCLSDFEKMLPDIEKIREKPRADAYGRIRVGDGTYVPLTVLEKILGFNPSARFLLAKGNGCRTLEGRNRIGRPHTFYHVEDARRLYADKIKQKKRQRRKRKRLNSN